MARRGGKGVLINDDVDLWPPNIHQDSREPTSAVPEKPVPSLRSGNAMVSEYDLGHSRAGKNWL